MFLRDETRTRALRGLAPIGQDRPARAVGQPKDPVDAGVSRLGVAANQITPQAKEPLVLDAAVGLPRALAADAGDDGLAFSTDLGAFGHQRTKLGLIEPGGRVTRATQNVTR